MRILKNRIFIAVACLVLAAAIAFWLVPEAHSKTRETATVLRVREIVPVGTVITPELLTTAEIGAYALPTGTLTAPESCIGLYAAVPLLPSDNLTAAKFTTADALGPDPIITRADRMNISVTVPSLAAGVAGKLATGDVIRIYAAQPGDGDMLIMQPPELSCMEVVSVVNAKAQDTTDAESSDATIAAAVTVVATHRQATTLVRLQSTATIHVALIGRDAAALEMLTEFNTAELPVLEQAILDAETAAMEKFLADTVQDEPEELPEGGEIEWQ
ncbi:MAG: RcpC/CpaB family pilus assembly protein [Christensenellales bacterium]